jgi:hypothetical protein
MRKLLACLILTATLACDESTDPTAPNGKWTANDTWAGKVVVSEDIDGWPNDPVTIIGATIRGDSLELSVSFGGGCRDHEFRLITNGVFAESYPVQTWVRLDRDANNDMCKALLSRVLRFDLSPLKALYNSAYQTSTGIMRIHVTNGISVTYSW